MVQLKTADDFGFLLCFIGGLIIIINAIVGLILYIAGSVHWFLSGGGIINTVDDTWAAIVGAIIAIVFGILCLVIGMKLFHRGLWKFWTGIDLIITSIIMIVLGIIVLGIGGILVIIGGILCLIYRLTPAGARNPTGK